MITLDQAKQLSANGHPLKGLTEKWLRLIKAAQESKAIKFDKYADEAMSFYNGAHDWMWKEDYAINSKTGGFLNESGEMAPRFMMTLNKVFEAVALFGPALYHQNPNVQVSPIPTPDITPEAIGIDETYPEEYAIPIMQQIETTSARDRSIRKTHSSVMQTYLNWVQQEGDKKTQARRVITEAIVKGLSFMWTDMYSPPGSNIQYPRSYYVSVDDVVVDPDARYWEDVQWVARRRTEAVNLVEEKFGLPPGSLRGTLRSKESQASDSRPASRDTRRNRLDQNVPEASSYDLITYWEVYSKNGMGQHIKNPEIKEGEKNLPSGILDGFGQFTYFAVAKNIPYFLNIPTWDVHTKTMEEIVPQAEWPIPFWADPNSDGGWPFSRLWFYEDPNSIWPISLFKPAIGEMRFVNWCMSFLADKVAASCKTYIGVLKEAGAEIKKQLAKGGGPFEWIELTNITGKGKLSDTIEFLQSPNFPSDIWVMISEVMDQIDKRTGLTELVYGMTGRQIRSAREAEVKESATNIRPDDMASRTEDFLSTTAAKEIQAARWACDEQDVSPVIGQYGAFVWTQQILTDDYDKLTREYTYRIEAGSARKPNKAMRADNLNQFAQIVMPTMEAMVMQGNPGPWNALVTDIAKNLDIDPAPYMIQLPQQGEEGPSEEEVKLEMEQNKAAMEMQFKELQHAQEMEHADDNHELQLEQKREQGTLDLQLARQKAKASKAS